MTWFKVDDQLHDHRKLRQLRRAASRCNALLTRGVTPDEGRAAALGIWVACGSWSGCNLSDGFVPDEVVARYDPSGIYAALLVEVELWHRDERDDEDGYQFHDWDKHQPTREKVLDDRAETARRVARHRAAKKAARASEESPDPPTPTGSNAFGNALHNAVSNTVSNTVPTRPDPTRPQEKPCGPVDLGSLAEYRARDDEIQILDPIPEDWGPHDRHRMIAAQRGLDLDHEARQFRSHALDKGRTSCNWHAAFESWLGKAGVEHGKRLRLISGETTIHRDPTTGRAVEW